jgi:hypothetical protein
VARTASLTTRVEVAHQLAGPLRDHAVVGSVIVSDGGQVIARVPAELSRALPAVSVLTIIGRFVVGPITLLVLVLLIGGAFVLGWRRRGGRRPRPASPELQPVAPAVPAAPPVPAVAAPMAASPPDPALGTDRAAAVERERRRAEREARRRAASADRAGSSAQDGA